MKVLFLLIWYKFGFIAAILLAIGLFVLFRNNSDAKEGLETVDDIGGAVLGAIILAFILIVYLAVK